MITTWIERRTHPYFSGDLDYDLHEIWPCKPFLASFLRVARYFPHADAKVEGLYLLFNTLAGYGGWLRLTTLLG